MQSSHTQWRGCRVDGLAYEVAGDGDSVPVVLVAGADTPGAAWPQGFVAALADAGRPVLRFDHREVGGSAGHWETYDLRDLADDVVTVSRVAFGTRNVHLVGSSMGGMVAQLAALDGNARSLTLIASSPGPGAGCSSPSAEYLEAAAELAFSVDLDRAQIAERSALLLAGSRYPLTTAAGDGSPHNTRHSIATLATPPWHERLTNLRTPTLVVHGTADPLFPPDHALLLAQLIPAATLIVLDGMGHQVSDGLAAEISPRLVTHMAEADH